MIFTGVVGRVVYIGYMGDNDLEGNFMGFRWLSIFLYNFGVEVSLASFGALMWISTNFHMAGSKSKKLFRFVAVMMMALAFFFMGWIFTDKPYWSNSVEILFAFLISIPATTLFVMLVMFLSREITNVRELKARVIDFFIEIRNVHFRALLKNAHKLDFLDDYNIESEARKEIKEQLRKERKNINKTLDDRLHEETYEIDS